MQLAQVDGGLDAALGQEGLQGAPSRMRDAHRTHGCTAGLQLTQGSPSCRHGGRERVGGALGSSTDVQEQEVHARHAQLLQQLRVGSLDAGW